MTHPLLRLFCRIMSRVLSLIFSLRQLSGQFYCPLSILSCPLLSSFASPWLWGPAFFPSIRLIRIFFRLISCICHFFVVPLRLISSGNHCYVIGILLGDYWVVIGWLLGDYWVIIALFDYPAYNLSITNSLPQACLNCSPRTLSLGLLCYPLSAFLFRGVFLPLKSVLWSHT